MSVSKDGWMEGRKEGKKEGREGGTEGGSGAETHRNEILYHIHMWKRVDFGDFVEVGVDPSGAS